MYCPRCGKEQGGEVNYCCHCGALVSKSPTLKRRLTLSATDEKVAGVCGGLAEYLEVDSTLVRLIWVLLALAGVGLIGYPIAWLIMPPPQGSEQKSKTVEASPITASSSPR